MKFCLLKKPPKPTLGPHRSSYWMEPVVKRSKLTTSLPSSADVKNEWSHISAPPIRMHGVESNNATFVILTHSTVQSPSWAANWFGTTQEIPRISQNPKVHYSTHKRPPPVSILGQPNPVHIPTSHLLEIRPNIIHPSTPRSLQWSLSLQFPYQDPLHPLSSTHNENIFHWETPTTSHMNTWPEPLRCTKTHQTSHNSLVSKNKSNIISK